MTTSFVSDEAEVPGDGREFGESLSAGTFTAPTVIYYLGYVSDNSETDDDGLITDFVFSHAKYAELAVDGWTSAVGGPEPITLLSEDPDSYTVEYISSYLDIDIASAMADGEGEEMGEVPQHINQTGYPNAIGEFSLTGTGAREALTAFVDTTYVAPYCADRSGHGDTIDSTISDLESAYPHYIAYRRWSYGTDEKVYQAEKFKALTAEEFASYYNAYSFAEDDSVMTLVLAALGNFSEPVFNFKKTKDRPIHYEDLSLLGPTDVTAASVTVTTTATETTDY